MTNCSTFLFPERPRKYTMQMSRIQKVNDNDRSLYCASNVYMTLTCHKLSSIIPIFFYYFTSNSYIATITIINRVGTKKHQLNGVELTSTAIGIE